MQRPPDEMMGNEKADKTASSRSLSAPAVSETVPFGSAHRHPGAPLLKNLKPKKKSFVIGGHPTWRRALRRSCS
jgi:hypothetical protein